MAFLNAHRRPSFCTSPVTASKEFASQCCSLPSPSSYLYWWGLEALPSLLAPSACTKTPEIPPCSYSEKFGCILPFLSPILQALDQLVFQKFMSQHSSPNLKGLGFRVLVEFNTATAIVTGCDRKFLEYVSPCWCSQSGIASSLHSLLAAIHFSIFFQGPPIECVRPHPPERPTLGVTQTL